jgi:hypothetical protein
MQIIFCPRCERQHDLALFDDGGALGCSCGARIQIRPGSRAGVRLAALAARRHAQTLAREADRVCRMILSSDSKDIDIALERNRLRALCEELFPDQMELYDMIYESRFDRLWAQFRGPEAAGA